MSLHERDGRIDALGGVGLARFERSAPGGSAKGTRRMQQAVRLAGLRAANFYAPHLCPFAHINVEDHVGEHVRFVKLGLGSNLSLEVPRRDKKFEKSPAGLGNNLLFVRRLVWNVDDLQQACVSKPLHGPRKLE